MTRIYKGFHGWKAEDYFDVTDLIPAEKSELKEGEKMELEIYTLKTSSGAINSTGIVKKTQPNGVCTYMPYQDFSKCLIRSSGRATEKSIGAQQAEAVTMLEEVKVLVKEHYAKSET